MQERRTLGYCSKDDIPSSAVAWDKSESITGNVLYIPLYSDNSNSINFYFPILGTSTYSLYNNCIAIIPAGGYNITMTIGKDDNVWSFSTTNATSPTQWIRIKWGAPTANREEDKHCVYLEHHSGAVVHLTCVTMDSSGSLANPGYGRYIEGYIKISFSGSVFLRCTGWNSSASKLSDTQLSNIHVDFKYPIYLDNE